MTSNVKCYEAACLCLEKCQKRIRQGGMKICLEKKKNVAWDGVYQQDLEQEEVRPGIDICMEEYATGTRG